MSEDQQVTLSVVMVTDEDPYRWAINEILPGVVSWTISVEEYEQEQP